jgi:tripartite ATP-independent transporter DctM subunit
MSGLTTMAAVPPPAHHEDAAKVDSAPAAWIRWLVRFVDHAGAVLLIGEFLLLSAAVFFRYVLNAPLIWSDELAEIVIIWQAMLGAVAAFHRNEHLRLSVVVRNLAPRTRQFLETLCLVFAAAVCFPLAWYAFKHVRADWDLVTPALEVSPAWRTGGLAAGLALIALLGAGTLASRWRRSGGVWPAIATVAVAALCLYLLRDHFLGLGALNLLIHFVGIGGLCMVIGLPIAFSFAVAAVSYVLLATHSPLGIITSRMESGMAHILLLSVPLFIALGAMLDIAGMARRMVEFLAALIGHVRAGLSYVLVGGMVLVSGISGSKAADMAAISPVLLPEMRKRGAKDGEMIALLAASSAMSETIPPSLILIMTGAVTGVSIGALFTAGWVPALVLALLVCLVARARTPKTEGAARSIEWKAVGRLAVLAAPILVLPFLIRGAVVEGIATATEVATIGIAYVLVVSLVLQRRFDWKRFYGALQDASRLTGTIFIILAAANAMAWGFIQSGFTSVLSGLAGSIPGGAYGFLVISVIVFVVLGSILEGIPAIVLLGPLLFPVAKSLGISEVHYALVAVMAMGLGLFAPPFGVGFYTACAIGRVNPSDAMKAIWPYLGVLLVGVLLVACFPWLTTSILR